MNKPLLMVITCLNISAWIDLISIMTWVGYELNFSPIAVALVSISMLAPQAILSRFITKTINRHNATNLLILTTAGRVVCTLGLIWANSLTALVPLLLLRALAIGFMQPIVAGEAQHIKKNQRAKFASLLNLINTLSKLIVPVLGGILAVNFGEQSVFAISSGLGGIAILGLLLFPLPTQNLNTTPTDTNTEPQKIPGVFQLGFGSCIVLAVGLSLTFSNLLPYTFSYYEVPKSLLSVALSASAVGAVLFNLMILRKNLVINSFPQKHLMMSCVLSAAAFASLSLTLITGTLNWVFIPLLFAAISGARAYFETYSNAFIFSCSGRVSVTLAAFKQGLAAYAGMAITLIGALSLTDREPFTFLISASMITLTLALIWGCWNFQDKQSAALLSTSPNKET
ncbi:Major Facilitator Superfamily protein [Pseudovibrio axinellae]|uniref:Major Facilitator Superfamily protein n=2 Tax=Pseudovibrio axinellae TaxID=989403 RepID=A0A161XG45_9HYPH|nr:Major Facilitator Superfamily protein [Pseudovibrio axinellae]SER22970.1 Predicted arabinose efflux permease, MFS family [Pseudovibrio axinellae]